MTAESSLDGFFLSFAGHVLVVGALALLVGAGPWGLIVGVLAIFSLNSFFGAVKRVGGRRSRR
jgi:hypothetical protein